MSDEMQMQMERPKTKVLVFKLGGDWDYNVTFQQTFQKQKIQTDDRPLDTLTTAIQNVVTRALNYFKLYEVLATFDSISFGDSDDGEGKFSITLSIKPRENQYIWIKSSVSNISREIVLDKNNFDDAPAFLERNELNEAVNVLEEEIKKYALGERLQKELPLESESENDFDLSNQMDLSFNEDNLSDGEVISVDFTKESATVR